LTYGANAENMFKQANGGARKREFKADTTKRSPEREPLPPTHLAGIWELYAFKKKLKSMRL